MKTFIREFETTEALVTLISTKYKTTAKVQKYNKDYSLPDISLAFPQTLDIKESEMTNTNKICKIIQNQLLLTNCYDLNDWKLL